MKAEIKESINKYLDAIGGIKSVRKSYRMLFLKAVIQLQNDLDSNGLGKSVVAIYPFGIMTKKYFEMNHKKHKK